MTAPALTSGILIAIEGIDGAGTTTQSRRLVATLTETGFDSHLTREPSDGPLGLLLREILAGNHTPIDATTLSLLFAADRADHLQREVEPALARGSMVISDRWYHSSLAYQGTGEERLWIRELNRRARSPDLTLFLEVNAEVAADRRTAAGRDEEIFDQLAVQRRVASGYRETIAMLRDAGELIEVIDGARPPADIAGAIAELARETCQRAGLRPRS